MTINTFRDECIKLQRKYGKGKVTGELLNQVWAKIKHLPDDYIQTKVSQLLTHKSIQGDTFSLEDFLPEIQEAKTPTEQQTFKLGDLPEKQKPKRKRKTGLNLPPYKYKSQNFKDGVGLKRYLDQLGASSAVEAMKMIASERNKS